jgi:hypothetical protein
LDVRELLGFVLVGLAAELEGEGMERIGQRAMLGSSLRAFMVYADVQGCASVAEVAARCRQLQGR